VTLLEDLEQCQDEFARLAGALEEKCGAAAPPTSTIRAALAACLEAVRTTARDRLPSAAPEGSPPTDEETAHGAASADGPAQAGGPIRNREGAFRALLQVAEFFRNTEPHTPVSYALEQAVRWGRMPLPELLTELIPDESARTQFFRQVGIRPGEPQ
jgi:type VI secretion system protein ImpA